MKRQRGRNRKPGGGGGGGGGGGNNPNRAFESNGPEGMKIRGNAQHVYERYQQLARDAFTSGDRVLAENHLQHAEHYFRVLRTLQPQRPVSEIAARDAFASGFDIDFEDETGGEAMGQDSEGGQDGGEGDGGDRQNGRENFQRESGGQRDNGDYRRDDREYRGENRDQRDFGGERDQRPARDFGGPRGEADGQGQAQGQGRRESRRERFERRRDRGPDQASDPLAVVEPRGAELPGSEPAPSAAAADDASHLPAFLRQPSTPTAVDETAERPRRGPRRRRGAEDDSASVEAAEEDA
jgi:hypothetical protein